MNFPQIKQNKQSNLGIHFKGGLQQNLFNGDNITILATS